MTLLYILLASSFAAELFRTRPQLLDKTLDMLGACIKDRLAVALSHSETIQTPTMSTAEGESAGELTPDVVYGVYRRFDRENDGDRAQILKNRKVIRRTLSGHWVTLRPLLCGVQGAVTEIGKAEEDIGQRMYQASGRKNTTAKMAQNTSGYPAHSFSGKG